MAKKLTVHAADKPRDSWLEVDGERVEGVESVQVTSQERSIDGSAAVALILRPANVVWEREEE
jgi:hypothetical protein